MREITGGGIQDFSGLAVKATQFQDASGVPFVSSTFIFGTGTTTTTFTAGQLTGASEVVYMNTGGTPGSIATRTAVQMFAEHPARIGSNYLLRISNAQATGTLTVTAGVGVTITGTATIAINTFRDFIVTFTSATAVTLQQIGIGTSA